MFSRKLWLCSCAVAVLHCSNVLAEETVASPGSSVTLDPITVTGDQRKRRQASTARPAATPVVQVTANKRPQDSNKVDGGVSVRTSQELRDAEVTSVGDLEKVFPGLVIRSRGNRAYANFTVRGMSSPDFYNPSVQVYVDGVPQSEAFYTQELVNVERVEFLRGPQGTLYGRNAYGGVINIITRKPRETSGEGGLTIAKRGGADAAVTLVPVKDKVFVDFALRGEKYGGQIDDIDTGQSNIDNSKVVNGRAQIRYAPSVGPFDATLTVARESLRSHEEFYLFDQLINRRAYRGFVQGTTYPLLDRDVSTAAFSWNYAFDGFKLSNVTAYQDVDLGRSFPFGTFFGPIQVITPEGKKTWSHESRLTYDGGGPLTGLLGVYLQDDRFTRDATTAPAFAPASNNKVDTRAAALFGEFTYALTSRLFLTAGTRFAYDEAAIDFNQPGVLAFSNSASFQSVQPKVSLGYQINDATRVYVLASRGYKPGGFNHTVSSIADATPYNAERALNLEAGVRTSLLNDRLWLSTAVYDIRSHDKQIYTGPIGFQVIRNIGDATSRGVELEARLRPADRLMLTATASYGRSTFDQAVDPVTGVTYNGNRIPYAPDLTAHLTARYVIEQNVLPGEVAVSAAAHFFSTAYFNEANTLQQPSYSTYDAALELGLARGVTFKVFATNLTDQVYRTYSFFSGPNIFSGIGEGRIVGASVRGQF
jgi:pesticin/yersiniabactin receptor